ncbi:rRNA maturation RNase YbeY [Leptolyngbya sp. FACHB-36]|uniref:rRNA maturation RNase YbeY n=1 Tax=Leptolyngbya sp. FACHB-36 TaxID=2692808 RepID=UPI001680402E|nr:rRNA maturation RNase YbeY [Leptolyngbya sp. FACHB-36]
MHVDVYVQNSGEESTQATPHLPLPETWQTWFQHWLVALQPDLSSAYELSLRLTDDREIQALNHQYRHQDKPTDVLAFAALEVEAPLLEDAEPLYLGDIVISIDTAKRQAQAQGHDLKTELAWLAAHGLLHLLGWDHPDDDRLVEMLDQQQALLQSVGLDVKT